jgi:superfamily II DNA or RNA helicase
MKLTINDPAKIRIEATEAELDSLRRFLTYHDKAAQFEYLRFKNNQWAARKMGNEAYYAELERLKNSQTVNLLNEDLDGFWTYSGLAADIEMRYKVPVRREIEYPEGRSIPWSKPPKFDLRPYQESAIPKLLDVKHGAIEYCTGAGKSAMILFMVKQLGLKTLVMAPTVSIAEQLYDLFCLHLGKKWVGFFGKGKKDSSKLITVGIAASLTLVDPKSEDGKNLADVKVFIADESHRLASDTYEKVAVHLVPNAPYRFSFSGTQMRGDGGGLLLKGLIGPLVASIDVKECVDGGYLAKPVFRIIRANSDSREVYKNNYKKMSQAHFLYNMNVIKKAADMANRAVELLGHQVLILVDEIDQFVALEPFLKHSVEFAHSSNNKDTLPAKYKKPKVKEMVERFNNGKVPILVGTSCINTGTDIKPVKMIINLQGGASEIETRQSVGRGTRLAEGKNQCIIVDFLVRAQKIPEDCDIVYNQGCKRINIYKNIYPDLEIL